MEPGAELSGEQKPTFLPPPVSAGLLRCHAVNERNKTGSALLPRMRTKRTSRRFVGVLIIFLTVATAATAGTAAAQSVDGIQTTLSDTDGDGTEDRIQVDVTVSDAARTEVVLDDTNFDVSVSPTDDTQTDIVQLDGNRVQLDSLGEESTTYTVVADISDQSDGDTGSVDVTVDEGEDTDTATYTVSAEGSDSGEGGEEGGGDGADDGEADGDGSPDDTDDDEEVEDGTEGNGGDRGETGDANGDAPSDGGADSGTDETSDDTDDGSGAEGLPGFTAVVTLSAVLSTVYYRKRNE